MIAYDNLAPEHFEEWGVEEFPHPSRTIGFACRRDRVLVAIGCCWVDEQDRWWANFQGRGEFPSGIHRKARDLFRALARADVKEVRADLDRSVPKAREWLLRLGFQPTDPAETEWILELHLPGHRALHPVQGG